MSKLAKWYCLDENNDPCGPLSTVDIAERLAKGELKKETLCWCEGRNSWQCAEDLAEIEAAVGAIEASKKEANVSVFDEVVEETEKKASFVDDDGTLYVWNDSLKKYEPKMYDKEEMTFRGDEEMPTLVEALEKEEAAQKAEKRKEIDPKSHWSDPKKTTSVYVTGLPLDASVEDVAVVFSKCGVIKEDEDECVRIKLYRSRQTGLMKGDGLVTYMKRPSVELAMTILNGTPFRSDERQTMTVQEATFEMKGERKSKKKNKKQKKNTKEDKLLGWSGFDDHLPLHKVTVVLHNMFRPTDFANDAITKEELKSEVESECSKLGAVDRVVVYRENEEGIVTVKFRTEEAADACVAKMHGRYFSARQITAHKWDGFTKYYRPKQSRPSKPSDEEERLEQFAKDLEEDGSIDQVE